MSARAWIPWLGAGVLVAATSGCASRVVAPLRYGPAPLAPDEPARAVPPRPGPPLPREPLAWRISTLDNGLRVVVLERHALPVVSLRLVVDRGSADAGASGEARDLLEAVMEGGTASLPAEALAESYALLGAAHDVDLGYDGCSLRAKAHATSTDAMVRLLAESAMRPRFAAEDFARTRVRWLETHAKSRDAVGASASRNLRALLFGRHHPYGYTRPPQSYLEGLRLDDVAALHGALFEPSRATLVVVGDVRAEDVMRSAGRWMGAWAPRSMPLHRASVVAPPYPEISARVVLVRASGAAGTSAVIAVPGAPAADDDAIVLEVIARALGGLSSPLLAEVRERQGAAYGFGGALTLRRLASSFVFGGQLDNAKATPALHAMLAAVRQVRAEGLSPELLEHARASLLGDWRQRTSSTDGLSGIATQSISLDVPLAVLERWPARVAAVTADDVRRVAARYLGDASLRVLVTGGGIPIEELGRLGLGPVERRDGFAEPVR